MLGNVHTINPYIRRAMQSVLPAGTRIGRRVIFDYELIYIEKGTFSLYYNEQTYTCVPGQFLFFRPGVPHSLTGFTADVSQPHIHFDMVYSSKSAQIPISFKDYPDMTQEEKMLIQKDVFENNSPEPFVVFDDQVKAANLLMCVINAQKNTLQAKAYLLELLYMLISAKFPQFFHQEEQTYSIVHQLKDYIDAGQGMTLTLDDLAKQFSYSKYYLERQFKKEYGVSLMVYRNQKRMELAQQLLKSRSVSAVADTLGFTSIYVFSRAFKQFFGVSPSAYQIKKT